MYRQSPGRIYCSQTSDRGLLAIGLICRAYGYHPAKSSHRSISSPPFVAPEVRVTTASAVG